MSTGILHLHLLLALIFVVALWKANPLWSRMAAALGVLLVVSGAFNFMTRMAGAPPGWHAFIGAKILLGLHAVVIAVLLARGTSNAAKAARWRKGALISASITLLIGLYFSNLAR